MTVALVYSHVDAASSGYVLSPATPPTPGNLMIVSAAIRNAGLGPSTISGWTLSPEGVMSSNLAGNTREHAVFYRIVQPGDTTWSMSVSSAVISYAEFSGVGAFVSSVSTTQDTNPAVCGGPITTSGAAFIYGAIGANFSNDTVVMATAPTSPNIEVSDKGGGAGAPGYWTAYRVESAAGTYTVGGTITGTGTIRQMGITLAFSTTTPPVADFTADHTTGVVPDTINFTDLSTNAPTSWAWTFGDGGTSTSQNPSHNYTVAGTYSVSLTATNSFGSDTITKTTYIIVTANVGYQPPPPAGALVEIYVNEAGAASWDDATWDDAVWSQAGWTDVTPYSIDVDLTWGSRQGELGILAQPDADSWSIDFYDPTRVLDPSNVDGPYYGDLRPNLPIRINHGSAGRLAGARTVRTGIVESLSYAWSGNGPGLGYARVTNAQSTYANAQVPHDTTLDDTLFARARSALSAAGLPVKVLSDPPAGDPALVAWTDTGDDQSVWQWISDAAQQVLWVPYFDEHAYLGFRDYRAPYTASRILDATRLINLMATVAFNGLYSRILVTDDTLPTAVVIERFTSTEYGLRTFTRSDPTPDAADWADAVLADRAFSSLRWIPGELYPLTKQDVNDLVRINGTELVTISDLYTSPVVSVDAIVVGGELRITAKKDAEAKWWFTFNTAQSGVPTPLAEDGSSPVEYLYRDGSPGVGSDEYLFPDA